MPTFLLTYLVHPGTAIYVGYNSDLQNLDHSPGIPTSGSHRHCDGTISTTAGSFS